MFSTYYIYVYKLIFYVVVLFLMASNSLAAISFNVQQEMDFAILEEPTQKETLTIKPNGNINASGTILAGTPQRAEFTISGATNGSATVTVENYVTGDNKLTLKNAKGRFENKNQKFPWLLDSSFDGGNRPFYIGAKLVYKEGVRTGFHTMQYDIVVTYE